MKGEMDRNGVPENIPLKSLHPTRTEYNAQHIVENGSVHRYIRDTGMDANENPQFGMIRDISLDSL